MDLLIFSFQALNKFVVRNVPKHLKNLVSGEVDTAYIKQKEWEGTVSIGILWSIFVKI